MSRFLGVVQTVLNPVLTALGVAVALHAIFGIRTTLLPLVWAVLSGVPLLVIGAFAIAGSPSTIRGPAGEGSLIPGAQIKLIGVWLLLNAPIQLLVLSDFT